MRIKPHQTASIATQVAWTYSWADVHNVSTLLTVIITRRPGVDSTRRIQLIARHLSRTLCDTCDVSAVAHVDILLLSRRAPACAVSRTDGTSRRVSMCRARRVPRTFKVVPHVQYSLLWSQTATVILQPSTEIMAKIPRSVISQLTHDYHTLCENHG
jgi:hypothetical protein